MNILKNMRVGTRLGLAFTALLALMLAMAGVGALLAKSINGHAQHYPEQILPALRLIHQVDGAIANTRRAEQQHILSETDKEKKALDGQLSKARGDLRQFLAQYETLIADDEDRALLKQVAAGADAYFVVQDKVLAASNEGVSDPSQATAARETSFAAARTTFLPLRQAVSKWWDYNEKLAEATTASAGAAYRRVLWTFAITSGIGLAIGVIAALVITRSITLPVQRASAAVKAVAGGDLTQRLQSTGEDELGELLMMLDNMTQNLASMVAGVRQGCEQINVAAAEIAQGNTDLSARTENQASSLEETAASVEQMAAQIKANADNARQADQLANHASEVAQAGGAAVGLVVTTMDAISASSRKIADIIGTIDGIAFQTNILALNAAVEAARAGEQGRGFAVVAGEVRLLAQRSAEAAKEIKSLIGDSVGKVESGSSQVLATRETIVQMVAEVRKVTDLVGEITVSSREQSEGVGQINVAVSQLDQATQQNAALVEETAAAAESMRMQSAKLIEAVAAFRVDAGVPPPTRASARPAQPNVGLKPVVNTPPRPPATRSTAASKDAGAPASRTQNGPDGEWASY